MYNTFIHPKNTLDLVSVTVDAKDIEKYLLYWLNSYQLNPITKKQNKYEISRLKPNMDQLLIIIIVLYREKDIQIIQLKHITTTLRIIKNYCKYHQYWIELIEDRLVIQLENKDIFNQFHYSFLLCQLFLYQHLEVFLDLQLNQKNVDDTPRRVDQQTKVLRLNGSYYDFVMCFVFQALNFISSTNLPRLSKLGLSYLKMGGDYYYF